MQEHFEALDRGELPTAHFENFHSLGVLSGTEPIIEHKVNIMMSVNIRRSRGGRNRRPALCTYKMIPIPTSRWKRHL